MSRSKNSFESEIEEIEFFDGKRVRERREHIRAKGIPSVLCALRSKCVLGTLVSFIFKKATVFWNIIKRKLLKHNYFIVQYVF